jgi:hypothetical protein
MLLAKTAPANFRVKPISSGRKTSRLVRAGVPDGTGAHEDAATWVAPKCGMGDALEVGVVPALIGWLLLSQAPTGVEKMHDALEQQAALPTDAPHYPRAEVPHPTALDRAREVANQHAQDALGDLRQDEHPDGTPQGKAAAAAASAQGQARANQVRKNPGKPPKPDGPRP